MIKQAKSAQEFLRAIGDKPYFRTVMGTSYALYHQHPAQTSFYCIDKSAAMCVTGHAAILCGEVKHPAEVCAFLHFCGIECVKTDGFVPEGFSARGIALMQYHPPLAPCPAALPAAPAFCVSAPDLRAVAQLISLASGAVCSDDFYSDACMRTARGLADIVAVQAHGTLLAAAGVYSLTEKEAYIAAVATHPAYRGNGYASALVGLLSQKYASRRVILECEIALCAFYARLGFQEEQRLLECVCLHEL